MFHPREEQTLLLIKPDGVKRGLIGDVISRLEKRGLKIIGLEMFWANESQIDNHYPKDEEWIKGLGLNTVKSYEKYGLDLKSEYGTDDPLEIGKLVRKWLVEYLAWGPMVKVAVKGVHAISMVRKIVGSTIPSVAEMGTIRGDFSIDDPTAANADKRAVRNLVHASGNQEEATHELTYWFSIEDIFDYKRAEDDVM